MVAVLIHLSIRSYKVMIFLFYWYPLFFSWNASKKRKFHLSTVYRLYGGNGKSAVFSLCLSVFKMINLFPSLLQMSLNHGDFFYYHYNLWIINNFNAQLLSCVLLFATPWTVAHQAPLSMGLSWQEYWSGLPFPPPFDLPLLPLLLLLSRFGRVWLCATL